MNLFKKYYNYTISGILLAAIFLSLKRRRELDKQVFGLIIASIIITILSEIAFALYTDIYGILNLISHYLKLALFFLIYKAITEAGMLRPFDLLFRKLKKGEQSLREKTGKLETVNKELESFVYPVSHDLRAPLRSIDGFSQALSGDYTSKLDENGKDYIRRIHNSTQRIVTLCWLINL